MPVIPALEGLNQDDQDRPELYNKILSRRRKRRRRRRRWRRRRRRKRHTNVFKIYSK
jgi:hypothetical protein